MLITQKPFYIHISIIILLSFYIYIRLNVKVFNELCFYTNRSVYSYAKKIQFSVYCPITLKSGFSELDIKGARKLETRFCVLQLVQFFQQIFSLEWGIPMDLSCVRYWPVCCALQLFHFGSVSLRSLSRKMTGRVEHSIAMATFNLEQRVQM